MYMSNELRLLSINGNAHTDEHLCIAGKKNAWICGVLIQMNLYGTGVAYTITTALCLRSSSHPHQLNLHLASLGNTPSIPRNIM